MNIEAEYATWQPFATSHVVPGCFPEYMQASIAAYLLDGAPMGDYLMALFAGHQFEAASRADGSNFLLFAWQVKWIGQMAPMGSYGSDEKVGDWMKRGGLSDKGDSCPKCKGAPNPVGWGLCEPCLEKGGLNDGLDAG